MFSPDGKEGVGRRFCGSSRRRRRTGTFPSGDGSGHEGGSGVCGEDPSPDIRRISRLLPGASADAPEAHFTALVKACACKYTCVYTRTSAKECDGKPPPPHTLSLTHLAAADQFPPHERPSSKGKRWCSIAPYVGIKNVFRPVWCSRSRASRPEVRVSRRGSLGRLHPERKMQDHKAENLRNRFLMF